MKKIKLTQGYEAIVDNEDFEELNQFKWHADISKYGVRARRNPRKRLGEKSMVLMTRQIMSPPKDMLVDHKNRNTLDNRKSNLRICTRTENNRNIKKRKSFGPQRSEYKGVCYHGHYGRSGKKPWRMFITFNKTQYSEYFETEIEAAKAYDFYALKHFGEFANLNFKNN